MCHCPSRASRRSSSTGGNGGDVSTSSSEFNKFGICRWKPDVNEEDVMDAAQIVVQAGSKLMSEGRGRIANITWHKTGTNIFSKKSFFCLFCHDFLQYFSGPYFARKNYSNIKKILEPTPFRAVLAIKTNPDSGGLLSQPISWSDPSNQEFIDSFDKMISGFKAVYGFSDTELHCTSNILKFVDGLDNNMVRGESLKIFKCLLTNLYSICTQVRRKRKYIKNRDMNKLHKRPREELKDLLKNEKIAEFRQKGQAKSRLQSEQLGTPNGSFELELTNGMRPEEYEGFVTLLWDTQVRQDLSLFKEISKLTCRSCRAGYLPNCSTWKLRTMKRRIRKKSTVRTAASKEKGWLPTAECQSTSSTAS